MLREEIGRASEASWAVASEGADWREIDRRLRGLARRRARLDHEEMEVLREAMRVQVWRQVGCASMREYLERVFGYGPRASTRDRSDARRGSARCDAGAR
jgi:hypothetical protein